MKVLVVEDDPFVREMAGMGLEDAGFEVIVADGGLEALKLLHAGIGRSYAGSQWLGRGPCLP
jgi:DNA-binding response OmpR family regulator